MPHQSWICARPLHMLSTDGDSPEEMDTIMEQNRGQPDGTHI